MSIFTYCYFERKIRRTLKRGFPSRLHKYHIVFSLNRHLRAPILQSYNIHGRTTHINFRRRCYHANYLESLCAPFVLLFSLVLAVLTLLHSLTAGVLSILALIATACGLFALTIGGNPASAVRVLIVAALISPFGFLALSEWLILKLGDLKYALRAI